ncbi:hypothetical protein V757_12215 [Pelistega indica]|uniref:Zinc-ribbon domain-containing protein n=1 Tax=Pelistega indica TaxID=1414851 RepID=V8FQZ3_9BURK|nr:hypothetical protein V757_12215 [Pelistega indica]
MSKIRRDVDDLTGQRFGDLTAEEYLGGNVWRWRCTCGKHRDARASYVKAGRTTKCMTCAKSGNRRTRDTKYFIGEVVGKLTIIDKDLGGLWTCLCACGLTTTLTTGQLAYRRQCYFCDEVDKLLQDNLL